jgi:hypothetical protein
MPTPANTRHLLRPHPASPAAGVSSLAVDARARGGDLELLYRLAGDMAKLRIPAPAPARRTDELWRHTCFEVFVALPGPAGYLEYNFSPSGAWAAYRFDDYRAGMSPLEQGVEPRIDCRPTDRGVDLHVTVDLAWLNLARPESPGALRLGLSAVIEDQAGVLSYWALAHASEKPDFHRAESFVAAIS